MNSYYFVVEIYRRKELQAVIEIERFNRLAIFMLECDSRGIIVEKYHDAEVKIFKAYVSNPTRIPLEEFKTNNASLTKRLAMEA